MKLRVKAAVDILVPREDDPRKYITEHDNVEIELSAYYRRAMKAGDLIEVTESAPVKSSKTKNSQTEE